MKWKGIKYTQIVIAPILGAMTMAFPGGNQLLKGLLFKAETSPSVLGLFHTRI